MQTVYIGNNIINDVYLGSQRMIVSSNLIKPIPKNGLVAYYDVANGNSYPGSGTVWYDLSGNGLNLRPVSSSNFPTYDATNVELQFNGTNNALFSTGSSTLITTTQTQIAWVRVARTGSINNGIYAGIQNQIGGGINGRWDGEGYGNQGTGWTLASSNADRPVSSNVTASNTDFVMIAATRGAGAGGFKLYLNGSTLIGSGGFSLVDYSAGSYPYVGSSFLNNSANVWGTSWFSGSISSFIVYNRVLTTTEIDSIYNLGRL